MKGPSQLPLAGFLNPSDRLPAFLVPVFGDGGESWVQDSEGDGRLLQFSPLTSSAEKVIPARNSGLSAKIGDLLIYAFQFPNAAIDVGSKSEMQVVLSKRLEELRAFPFLMIDVLDFLENSDALPSAILVAKERIAQANPKIADQWAALINTRPAFTVGSLPFSVVDQNRYEYLR